MDSSEEPVKAADEGGGFDLRYYLTVIKKRWWVIALATIVITAGSVVYTARKPKIFQATATVVVEPQAPNVLGKATSGDVVSLGSGSPWVSIEYYNTQYQVITSRRLARLTV